MQNEGPGGTYAARLLSNGSFTTLLGLRGGGFAALDGYALTRWVPDPARDIDGFQIYVRDLETGSYRTVSGGAAPPASGCDVRFDGGVAEFRNDVDDIECTVEVCVVREQNAELRRITLRNTGSRPRRLDITTYAEIALNTLAADAAHPGFSKLFIQTGRDVERDVLIAWRRPRSPQDRRMFVAHRLLAGAGVTLAGFETDRARFIGRGRDTHHPDALVSTEPLSGTTGNVLDPVFSLRGEVRLEPGAETTCVSVLNAASSSESLLHTLDQVPDVTAAAAAFVDASAAPADAIATLGLPHPWREQIRVLDDRSSAPRIEAPQTHARVPILRTASRPPDAPRDSENLRLFNGWGGFSAEGSEYVIRMPLEDGAPRRPPLPWVNVMANESAGCIVSESGAMHTWSANSRENRLTPWFNDPITDPYGEALYIRDDDSGAVWSPLPGPIPGAADYEVRHGFGHTRFIHESRGLEHDTHIFVPADAAVRIARVRLTNRGAEPRTITLCAYAQLVLGTHEADTRGRIETWRAAQSHALLARNPERGEFSGRVAFASLIGSASSRNAWTTDRRAFLGAGGRTDAPAGVFEGALDGWTGAGHDACFVLSRTFVIPPGGTAACAFVLGEDADAGAAGRTLGSLATIDAVDRALATARAQWHARVSTVRIETPVPALDVMVNGWLAYQNLSCRMWARTAYYQSGGAFGFRDQLQDSSALLYIDPAYTRAQILLHAAHQFVEGDVLHWWHPPLSKGIRTRFSDDLLWLPYITSFYISRTGDREILDEDVRYLDARPLDADEDEAFVVPEVAAVTGSLYDHCCRALDRSLTAGAHGLPLMGVGDWNDGMNRVGREGRGESVWLAFFLYDILDDFLPLCTARGDFARAGQYRAYQESLGVAINEAGWDGSWYRRAYYDDGAPLGSAESDEGRIDALAQAWSVLSGVASDERAALALDAMEAQLVDETAGLIRLLTPPFDRTPHDPGYIRGYLPGVRENGGQYTHGVLWAVRALAEHGRAERAAHLLEMLSPATRGGTHANAQRYRVEPYVVAADVYGVAPHIGRGGWTWYTGSAGWMYRVALESILGLELRHGAEIALRPCIPASWPGFRITLSRPDGTVCDIVVTRGEQSAVALDGRAGRVDDDALVVPLPHDGARHEIRAVLGSGFAPRYSPRQAAATRSGRSPG